MPHKFNAERRDKFTAARYRVTNWRDYNEALRMRGDVSVWFEDGEAGAWHAPRRKLHIGIDRDSGEIVASLLTTDRIGDEAALPDLIAGLGAPVAKVLGDGAYDGTAVFTALRTRFGDEVEVIIPPPRSAVPGLYG